MILATKCSSAHPLCRRVDLGAALFFFIRGAGSAAAAKDNSCAAAATSAATVSAHHSLYLSPKSTFAWQVVGLLHVYACDGTRSQLTATWSRASRASALLFHAHHPGMLSSPRPPPPSTRHLAVVDVAAASTAASTTVVVFQRSSLTPSPRVLSFQRLLVTTATYRFSSFVRQLGRNPGGGRMVLSDVRPQGRHPAGHDSLLRRSHRVRNRSRKKDCTDVPVPEQDS